MPPQSRGPPKPAPLPAGFVSKSTPNLPTLKTFKRDTASDTPSTLQPSHAGSPDLITSPSEPASIDDFSLDPSLSPASSSHNNDEDDDISDQDSEEEDTSPISNLPTRPIYQNKHSRSHTHLAPSAAFAPPFYNRPPTPLPPSPSLTSLLRPTFSTANSRPTTPDPSSDENTAPPPRPSIDGAQTPNSTAASTLLRSAKPIPRASPKVPTYEYYGFTLYLTSSLAFIVYLFWSILPSPFLHQLGIYYYPNRWWALAIPAWTVMFIVYIYVALAAYNTAHLTLPLNSVETLVDEAANIAVVDAKGNIIHDETPSWQGQDEAGKAKASWGRKGGKRQAQQHARQGSLGRVQGEGELDWRTLWMEGTDAVMDIPVGGVCEILYGMDEGEQDD